MSATVFANGMSICWKGSSGKTTAAMPDVCLSPPTPPAGPIPIPYPNTSSASDTDKGSTTVMIGGDPVALKDRSIFKTSTGNEAATRNLGMGVVTHKIQGEAQFIAWSMDVKFEGENVPRHMDLMGHNEACTPSQTPPWPFADAPGKGKKDPCKEDKEKEEKACKDYKPQGKTDVCKAAGLSGRVVQGDAAAARRGFGSAGAWADDRAKKAGANKCVKARRCQLVPYGAKKDGIGGCCPSQTPDHLIPKSSFYKLSVSAGTRIAGWKKYSPSKAPCMCAEGGSNTAGSHGLRHALHMAKGPAEGSMQSFNSQANLAASSATKVFRSSGCSKACIKKQLENGHKGMGDLKSDIKHSPSGSDMTEGQINSRLKSLKLTKVLR